MDGTSVTMAIVVANLFIYIISYNSFTWKLANQINIIFFPQTIKVIPQYQLYLWYICLMSSPILVLLFDVTMIFSFQTKKKDFVNQTYFIFQIWIWKKVKTVYDSIDLSREVIKGVWSPVIWRGWLVSIIYISCHGLWMKFDLESRSNLKDLWWIFLSNFIRFYNIKIVYLNWLSKNWFKFYDFSNFW